MLVWLSLSSLSILRQVNDDDDEDVSASGNVANAKAQDDGDLVASL